MHYFPTSIMMRPLRMLYHTRKPRVISPTTASYQQYQNALRSARRQVHLEAKQYQDKI